MNMNDYPAGPHRWSEPLATDRIAAIEADLAAAQAQMAADANFIRQLAETCRKAEAEALALRAALTQIADPNGFIHSGSSAELARTYEDIAHAALDAAKGEGWRDDND